MPPLDARLLAVIVLMGAASIVVKAMELWDWHVNRKPVVIDTSTNGGVKAP